MQALRQNNCLQDGKGLAGLGVFKLPFPLTLPGTLLPNPPLPLPHPPLPLPYPPLPLTPLQIYFAAQGQIQRQNGTTKPLSISRQQSGKECQ